MAAQPLSNTIRVYQRLRSYRQMLRHNNVKAMCNRMRPLVMALPGIETQVVSTYDGDSSIVTTALTSDRRGLPIVRYLRPIVPMATAAESVAGLDFPITVGADVVLQSTQANLGNDLFAQGRALNSVSTFR